MFRLQKGLKKTCLNVFSKYLRYSTTTKCDALVLGGGIGGASTSYQLAKLHNLNVICLEKEIAPGYHATGKSHGIFSENNARTKEMKILSAYSRSFFESPDPECIDNTVKDYSVLSKIGLIAISSTDDYPFLYKEFGPNDEIKFSQNIEVLPQKDVINYVPFLNPNELAPYAIYESTAANFNTGLVYELYLIGGNKVDVNYYFNQSVVEINKLNNGNWEISSYNSETNNIDRFESSLLVNASGQWSDNIAIQAGIKPINLVTHQRNVIVFTYTNDDDNNKDGDDDDDKKQQTSWIGWISPNSNDIFYSCFQGNSGIFIYEKLINNDNQSENDSDVIDVTSDNEMEICLNKIHKYTKLKVNKMVTKSAGIKCSVANDPNIVIGPDVNDHSFIWVAGLSSYGIQTAPAYSTISSYLAVNKPLPQDIIDLGFNLDAILPSRLLLRS